MASRIEDELSYYLLSVYYSAKGFFIYRTQAWLWLVNSVLSLLFSLVLVTVIYSVSSGIAGWSYYQLMFLMYLMSLTFGIASFLSSPGQLPYALRTGQLDIFMTRPFSILTISMSNSRNTMSIVGIVGSIVFLAYASLHMQLSTPMFAEFLPLYLLGVAAFVLFLQSMAVLSYKLIKSGSFINQLTSTLSTFTNYPLPIFGGLAQMFFTLLVPIGIAGYYPLEVLLGNVTPAVYVAMIALSAIFIAVFHWTLNRLMRSYESGGG